MKERQAAVGTTYRHHTCIVMLARTCIGFSGINIISLVLSWRMSTPVPNMFQTQCDDLKVLDIQIFFSSN